MTNKEYIFANKNSYQVMDAVCGNVKSIADIVWHIEACFSIKMPEGKVESLLAELNKRGLADGFAITKEGEDIFFERFRMEQEKKEEKMRKKREEQELKRLRKLNRDELNEALDALKKLRQEEPYSGELPTHNAMCYSTSMPKYYEWDKIPSIQKCAGCGKVFGEKGSFAKRRSYNEKGLFVDKWDYQSVVRIGKELSAFCFDVKIDYHCSNCITGKKVPPIIYHVKMLDDSAVATSYPAIIHVEGIQTGLRIWQYNRVTDCLQNIIGKACLINHSEKEIEEYNKLDIGGKVKFWLDDVRSSRGDSEGQPWDKVYGAIEEIFGLKIDGGKA